MYHNTFLYFFWRGHNVPSLWIFSFSAVLCGYWPEFLVSTILWCTYCAFDISYKVQFIIPIPCGQLVGVKIKMEPDCVFSSPSSNVAYGVLLLLLSISPLLSLSCGLSLPADVHNTYAQGA